MRIFAFLFASLVFANEGFDYLNLYRVHSGASLVSLDPYLTKAASTHGRYLAKNKRIGHIERQGDPGFSGKTPFDRAASAGVATRMVVENVSYGERDFFGSLDTLFAAIYHRFAFLNPYYDRIGLTKVQSNKGYKRIYVYTLTNSQIDRICREAKEPEVGYVYTNLCSNGKKIAQRVYQHALNEVAKHSKPLIIWPSEGAVVNPAFYEEIPDPLPQCSVSGYPVSVTFNPLYFPEPQILQFTLKSRGKRVGSKLLTNANDPHHKLKPFEFALMPLKRLDFGREYAVYLRFRSGGKVMEKQWSFRTKKAPFRLIYIKKRMRVVPHRYYTFYYNPKGCNDVIYSLYFRCTRGVRVRYKRVDKNSFNALFLGQGRCDLKLGKKRYKLFVSNFQR